MKNNSFRTVASFLQENVYHVPDYQREYAWEESEIDDFWMDLENVINENLDSHFLGQIVIHDSISDSMKFIIDGQQRTCTSVILLSVFRSHFEKLKTEFKHKAAENRYEDIRIKYIGRWSNDENELKLFVGKADREYFRSFIQCGDTNSGSTELTSSQKRIKNAYHYFNKAISDKISNIDDPDSVFEIVNLYYKAFIEKFHVLYIETEEINEAFIIFETLNARGKDLETSDLLKNHIFRHANTKLESVKKNWQEMIDTLNGIDATRFIRYFYNSSNVFVREKDLYKKIREKIITPKKADDLSVELNLYSKSYCALENPEKESFYSDKNLVKSLINLKIMSASSFYPIVLAMTNTPGFSHQQIGIVVNSIEVLVFRNFVVAGKVSNRYELSFADIAYRIHENALSSVEEITKEIKDLTISDDEFTSAFASCSIKKKPVIRYFFQKVNQTYSGEVAVIEDNNLIHIEHIMPVTKGVWNITDEQHQEYLWRIGNLTLLGKEFNQAIQNNLFPSKKVMYSESLIQLNKELCNFDDWNIESIQSRQTSLGKLSLKIWKL